MYIYTQTQINKFSSSHLVDTNLSVVKVPVDKADNLEDLWKTIQVPGG